MLYLQLCSHILEEGDEAGLVRGVQEAALHRGEAAVLAADLQQLQRVAHLVQHRQHVALSTVSQDLSLKRRLPKITKLVEGQISDTMLN